MFCLPLSFSPTRRNEGISPFQTRPPPSGREKEDEETITPETRAFLRTSRKKEEEKRKDRKKNRKDGGDGGRTLGARERTKPSFSASSSHPVAHEAQVRVPEQRHKVRKPHLERDGHEPEVEKVRRHPKDPVGADRRGEVVAELLLDLRARFPFEEA